MDKLVIHLESRYFEAPERTEGARFNSIIHLFNDLGDVLQSQKTLAHVEIHGDSIDGKVFAGLKAVLKLRALKTLVVSGIPYFFDGGDCSIRCRRLQELSLQGVAMSTEQARKNLELLIKMNSDLTRLSVIPLGPRSMSSMTQTVHQRSKFCDMSNMGG